MAREDGAASLGHRLLTRSLQEPVRLRSCVDAVHRTERHEIFRLLVAPPPDTSGKRVCLLENDVTIGRRDCFFYIYHKFDEGLASLFNIETSLPEGSICTEADRAGLIRYVKRTVSCRHRRTLDQNEAKIQRFRRKKRLAEPVPSGKRVSADTGRCNLIHLK